MAPFDRKYVSFAVPYRLETKSFEDNGQLNLSQVLEDLVSDVRGGPSEVALTFYPGTAALSTMRTMKHLGYYITGVEIRWPVPSQPDVDIVRIVCSKNVPVRDALSFQNHHEPAIAKQREEAQRKEKQHNYWSRKLVVTGAGLMALMLMLESILGNIWVTATLFAAACWPLIKWLDMSATATQARKSLDETVDRFGYESVRELLYSDSNSGIVPSSVRDVVNTIAQATYQRASG